MANLARRPAHRPFRHRRARLRRPRSGERAAPALARTGRALWGHQPAGRRRDRAVSPRSRARELEKDAQRSSSPSGEGAPPIWAIASSPRTSGPTRAEQERPSSAAGGLLKQGSIAVDAGGFLVRAAMSWLSCVFARTTSANSTSRWPTRKASRSRSRPTTAAPVKGNRELVSQALANLVDNAIKYAEPAGRLNGAQPEIVVRGAQ